MTSDAMMPDAEVSTLLRAIDHPVPDIPVAAVIDRARRARRRAWLGAAAVLFVTGAAAAAVPHGVIGRYVRSVLGRRESVPQVAGPPAPAAPQAARGVSFVPGVRVEIAFRESQTRGVIRLRLDDAPAVRLSHDSSVAAYTLTANGVSVDNPGSGASYTLVIPHAVARVRVSVDGRVVFDKDGDRVSVDGRADPHGGYVIPMQARSP